MLGGIHGDEIRKSEAGEIVDAVWTDLPNRFPAVSLDAYVIMPNHLHGLIRMQPADGEQGGKKAVGLGKVIRAFKAVSTRSIRVSTLPDFCWQPNYYEHVIRKHTHIDLIREYIAGNPARWIAKQNTSGLPR